MKILIKPEIFALFAAILNGSIGIFTRFAFGFDGGLSPTALAFWKCFVAFLLIALIGFGNGQIKQEIIHHSKYWYKFALLGFLGIFCLYFFETWAFYHASIPLVSFLTYAAGGVTLLLSVFFLGERLNIYKIIAFFSIIFGVSCLFLFNNDVYGSYLGFVLALLGGLGYALFIFVSKVLKVGGGIAQLFWLFAFGSVYLFIPYSWDLYLPNGMAWLMIFCLVLLPTIGGFYLTTKAVEYGEASKVQIIETSDPLFATLLALIIFGDVLSLVGYIGALFIFVGIIIMIKSSK
ncbi:membrane protein [Moraxella ovis]|uniref:Carboxylate/amino acid/amine transporter n=1 Tax=Moraxella ovis TaxID=29433 RepID=A0A378PLR5_9GAMM|nr:DMT family transporter [Moraxella ovis]ANB91961.1 membrane protein [Moraxella ovis]STY87703.1 carboxylate/amino acid/amine transporter [Moraxella ovis]